jgi:cell shape-determining protein MreC
MSLALCFLGGALIVCPDNVTDAIRSVVHDTTRPGQLAVRTVADTAIDSASVAVSSLPGSGTRNSAIERELLDQIAALESARRKSAVVNTRLREELEAAKLLASQRVNTSSPLLQAELVAARVIGQETLRPWQGRPLLASGSAHGVPHAAFVLADDGHTMLDIGADTSLNNGESIFAGRTVLGKIVKVTQFTSTVQRVTDRGYRGAARLARETSDGLVFRQAGTLEGDGSDLCRMKLITEPVNVGDQIYTADTDGILPSPMYYGQIARAELKPGATEWDIWVRPARVPDRLQTVHVLRTVPNPARVSAN